MGTNRDRTCFRPRFPAAALRAGLCAGALLLAAVGAAAQEAKSDLAVLPEHHDVFSNIMRWFNEQAAHFNDNLKEAGSQLQNFGREAGIAARTTVDGAKDAADAVARIPHARVISGHEKCRTAPNGAPDCVTAAMSLCKANGYESGKSVDMTTAEVCPAEVYLAGRNSGPGCHTETFVSRVLCQ